MREILFRGKTKTIKRGEWIEGSLVNTYDWYTREQHCFIVDDDYEDHDEWEVDPQTVGQYTGLKDKNGKLIFEGDIYHHGDLNIKYIVQWLDSGFKGKQLKSSSHAGLEYWADKIEIIGNIHDIPELLEGQK